MKHFLLPEKGNFYKANLHCHTTCSDGKLTPEQIKAAYMEKGYKVVAYTDHYLILPHNDLTDENFVALNGYELEVHSNTEPVPQSKKTHLNLIALDPDNLLQIAYHRSKYVKGNMRSKRAEAVIDESLCDYERIHSPECISNIMHTARDNGYFVVYNHPEWSLDDYRDYANYDGMHALEIYNYSSHVAGIDSIATREYDDILRTGKRIFCVGADDNHNKAPLDSTKCDSFGAFTMIKAPKLEYTAITDALVKGNFYASMGPEIKELYFEDGKVFIKTSPSERIVMHCGCRRAFSSVREKGKKLVSASFSVPDDAIYIRLSVEDKCGKRADTNAYFVDAFI
ncbi:MAG: PHP domain-containing protein [Ruminococcaceae bacterium]|nr:PHP domain-containing protein [Oscillospiraceae bacterium]